jgi:hypothetical protein
VRAITTLAVLVSDLANLLIKSGRNLGARWWYAM